MEFILKYSCSPMKTFHLDRYIIFHACSGYFYSICIIRSNYLKWTRIFGWIHSEFCSIGLLYVCIFAKLNFFGFESFDFFYSLFACFNTITNRRENPNTPGNLFGNFNRQKYAYAVGTSTHMWTFKLHGWYWSKWIMLQFPSVICFTKMKPCNFESSFNLR